MVGAKPALTSKFCFLFFFYVVCGEYWRRWQVGTWRLSKPFLERQNKIKNNNNNNTRFLFQSFSLLDVSAHDGELYFACGVGDTMIRRGTTNAVTLRQEP